MGALEIVFGIVLLLMAGFLIVAVLLQTGKEKGGLSGAIAGGADTFFGKNGGDKKQKRLSRWTTIVAIAFVIVVIAMYILVS